MAEKAISLLNQRDQAPETNSRSAPSTAPTRIYLRSSITGEYFAGPGIWTSNRAEAISFETSTQAVYLVIEQRLRNIELLLAIQDIPYDIHLPVRLPAECFA